MKAALLLDACKSFEHRGSDKASLLEVNGSVVSVIRFKTDFSDVIGDKPCVKNLCSNLNGLVSGPRDVLSEVIRGLSEAQDQKISPKSRPPSM